jgi:arylsulfatase A-like enzyme
MDSVSRRKFLQTAGAGILAGHSIQAGVKTYRQSSPNIIVIVSDDHRYDALGCMGNPVIKTPVLDDLAAGGVLFPNNCCTTSICCSSRASILTGMYTSRHKIIKFDDDLNPELWSQSYPVLLRRAGYHTGFVGKFGVGTNLPENSFNYWRGIPGQGKYWNEINGQKRHITDIFTEDALEFFDTCPADQPFCLSISFKSGHTVDYDPRPWQPKPEFEELYKNDVIPVPPTATEEAYQTLPEFLKNSEGRCRWKNRFITPTRYQETVKDYYRLLTGMDSAIGKIRSRLVEKDLADNTIIIYQGDNGFYMGEKGLAGKWYAHEVSMKTPSIIFDPRLSKKQRGLKSPEMSLNLDITPTILDWASIPIPDNVQGLSLVPLLEGKKDSLREDCFYEHPFEYEGKIPQSEGIRSNSWKYIRWISQDPVYEELYDLKNDPDEMNNLARDGSCQSQLKKMRSRWAELREECK